MGTAYDENGYGGMAYYSSDNECYTVGHKSFRDGCSSSYDQSHIKYVVDAWKDAEAPLAIEAKLIDKEAIITETREYDPCGHCGLIETGEFAKSDWIYNSNYSYWTMSQVENSMSEVLAINKSGLIIIENVYNYFVVRLVIVLSKSLLS